MRAVVDLDQRAVEIAVAQPHDAADARDGRSADFDDRAALIDRLARPEQLKADERTARNYMEIAKSAAAADLHDDTTMRSALRALASRSQSKEPKNGQTSKLPADGRFPIEDDAHISGTETIQAPRAGLAAASAR